MILDKKLKLEIESKLKENYNIVVNRIEKNRESTEGNVYMVITNKSKYVIKIYDDIHHTNSIVELHDFLNLQNVIVPLIIRNLKEEKYTAFNNKYIVVFSFMGGKHIIWDKESGKLKDSTIKGIAKSLRKLHDTTKNKNIFNLPELTFGKKLERNSVLHFDLTKHNIFINAKKGNQVGFIDFDDAKYGPSVCDVAIIISILFFSKTNGANLEDAYKFVNEYYGEDIELKNKEIPLIKEFSSEWIDYLLSGNQFDTSTKESFVVRKGLINNYLFF